MVCRVITIPNSHISSRNLPLISAQITDPIPAEIKQHYQLIDKKALTTPFSNDINLFNKAKYRIIFEEFLIYQLQVVKHKNNRQQKPSTHPLVCNGWYLSVTYSNCRIN